MDGNTNWKSSSYDQHSNHAVGKIGSAQVSIQYQL